MWACAAICATLLLAARPAPAQQLPIISGSNPDVPKLAPEWVPFNPTNNDWTYEKQLVFDPSSGYMEKHFQAPTDPSTGEPITLVGDQPVVFPIWEFFEILPGTTVPGSVPTTVPGQSVSDWHEEIKTPGWVWVKPGDQVGGTVFLPGDSLITRDGEPWPSTPIDMPNPSDDKLWVEFEPIDPGHVLDIHKGLLWVGTTDNPIWGDEPDEEYFIRVCEYPTPEPSALALIGLGGLVVLRRRR
jgi:hypothetical protein